MNEPTAPQRLFTCKGFAERMRDQQRFELEERKAAEMRVGVAEPTAIPEQKDSAT